ncbi:MAG: hypothetical protein CUN55_12300 [Phototrophicales bacterium]|nr:MAG: hypothetical protein CUN55_12300 [Phototrophicales bacterium]
MSSRHPSDEMPPSDEMAWPRLNEEDTNDDVPDESDAPPEPDPIVRQVLRERPAQARPLIPDPEVEAAEDAEVAAQRAAELEAERQERYLQQRETDPIIALMIIGAISLGLTPLDAVVRYVILWSLLGGAGLIAYILGSSQRISHTTVDDLIAGVSFGGWVGVPLMIALGTTLARISERMFNADGTSETVMNTWVFMAVVFVQPSADTLFFRGAMQQFRGLMITTLLATIWTITLYFPHMNLRNATGVAVTIAIFFTFLNFLYSYVRARNGLAAAWICQIITGSLLWFWPRILF